MFPLARSVTPATGGARNAQPIVETSAQSWAESDVKALAEGRPVAPTRTDDRRARSTSAPRSALPAPDAPPPAPAQPGQPPADAPKRPETRVVVFGDSDFAANERASASRPTATCS